MSTLIPLGACVLTFMIGVLCTVCIMLSRKKTEDTPLSLDYTSVCAKQVNKIVSDWISDEIDRTQMIISTTGFNYTFLGKIALINFKAIGIIPEVEITLQRQLKDTEEIRSFSHFLDLVRTLYLNVDNNYLEHMKYMYFTGLSSILGPTPYTHTNKQIKYLQSTYPWLWILEYISTHPKVQRYFSNTSSIVEVDKTPHTTQGIPLPDEDGAIAL